jgi:hypothetical protein
MRTVKSQRHRNSWQWHRESTLRLFLILWIQTMLISVNYLAVSSCLSGGDVLQRLVANFYHVASASATIEELSNSNFPPPSSSNNSNSDTCMNDVLISFLCIVASLHWIFIVIPVHTFATFVHYSCTTAPLDQNNAEVRVLRDPTLNTMQIETFMRQGGVQLGHPFSHQATQMDGVFGVNVDHGDGVGSSKKTGFSPSTIRSSSTSISVGEIQQNEEKIRAQKQIAGPAKPLSASPRTFLSRFTHTTKDSSSNDVTGGTAVSGVFPGTAETKPTHGGATAVAGNSSSSSSSSSSSAKIEKINNGKPTKNQQVQQQAGRHRSSSVSTKAGRKISALQSGDRQVSWNENVSDSFLSNTTTKNTSISNGATGVDAAGNKVTDNDYGNTTITVTQPRKTLSFIPSFLQRTNPVQVQRPNHGSGGLVVLNDAVDESDISFSQLGQDADELRIFRDQQHQQEREVDKKTQKVTDISATALKKEKETNEKDEDVDEIEMAVDLASGSEEDHEEKIVRNKPFLSPTTAPTLPTPPAQNFILPLPSSPSDGAQGSKMRILPPPPPIKPPPILRSTGMSLETSTTAAAAAATIKPVMETNNGMKIVLQGETKMDKKKMHNKKEIHENEKYGDDDDDSASGVQSSPAMSHPSTSASSLEFKKTALKTHSDAHRHNKKQE